LITAIPVIAFCSWSGCSPQEESQLNDSLHVFFGMASSGGKQVIVREQLPSPTPQELVAVSAWGTTCVVRFLEHRKSPLRQSSNEQFDTVVGDVFEAQDSCMAGGETIVLVTEEYLKRHKSIGLEPIPYTPNTPYPSIDGEILKRIEQEKGLNTVASWAIATVIPDGFIGLVQFEPERDTALACLVVVRDGTILYEDYRGNANDEYSVWRVDDGGEFAPQTFHILAAFESSHGIEIVRAWDGFEGQSVEYLRAANSTLKSILSSYRYWGAH
jgi:hypothetical protein